MANKIIDNIYDDNNLTAYINSSTIVYKNDDKYYKLSEIIDMLVENYDLSDLNEVEVSTNGE